MWEDALFSVPFLCLGCWVSARAGEVKGKWCPCVPYGYILCLGAWLKPLYSPNQFA